MKRSFINSEIAAGIKFLDKMKVKLPPFAYWTANDWTTKGPEYNEIRECMLGWDITDFGSDNFESTGLLLFTIRNGIKDSKKYFKPYAEKCLIVKENQITPMHYHYHKMEDIINRGGGDLMIQVYNCDKNSGLASSPVEINMDGKHSVVDAGSILRLTPGQSITLPPFQYHKFWAHDGTVVVGEVSMVNDDNADNHFHEPKTRFSKIEEDEPAKFLLFSEC